MLLFLKVKHFFFPLWLILSDSYLFSWWEIHQSSTGFSKVKPLPSSWPFKYIKARKKETCSSLIEFLIGYWRYPYQNLDSKPQKMFNSINLLRVWATALLRLWVGLIFFRLKVINMYFVLLLVGMSLIPRAAQRTWRNTVGREWNKKLKCGWKRWIRKEEWIRFLSRVSRIGKRLGICFFHQSMEEQLCFGSQQSL